MTTTTTTGGTPLVVGLGGTLRANSSTERALRYCLASVERQGGRTRFFSGPELDLPMYAPHELERTPKALELVSALRDADAVVVGSPGYHGAISGSGEERARLHRGSARRPARLPRQHPVGLHQLRLRLAGGGRHPRASCASSGTRCGPGRHRSAWRSTRPTRSGTTSGELVDDAVQGQLDMLATQVLALRPRRMGNGVTDSTEDGSGRRADHRLSRSGTG